MMKVFVTVLCALAAVTATPLLGTEQCAKGPSVWCVNIQTANQCGAVTHCQQTVWSRPIVKSLPCDVCKEVVTAVSNFLKDNATQSEIMSLLQKTCEFIPNPALVSECKMLIQTYFPILLNMIEEETSNPGVTCSAMGMCQSLQQHLASIKENQQLKSNEIPDVELSKMVPPFMANVPLLLFPQEKVDHTDKDVCGDCIKLISDIQDNLKSNSSFSRGLINNALKQCEQLGGGLSDMCKNYVNQYGDLALQMIIQMPANTICSGAGLCTEEKATPPQEMPAKVNVPAMKLQPAMKIAEKTSVDSSKLPTCELCELVIEQVEKFLDNNRSRAHIKEALEKVCIILPSKYCDQCKCFMDQYSDILIALLENEGAPKVICTTIGLCSEREPKVVKLDGGNGFVNCEMCQLIMKYMDKLLEKNTTQEKIKEALMKVCNFLPKSDLDECCSVIKAYEPLIMALLLQELEPRSVCAELGCCQAAKKPLLGSEKCMWGPSYWCKDLETAGSCNAIEHCKRHVWN